MVQVAASIAHAASTALPPFAKISAPAVAASGLPVIATQWRPCSTGLTVRRAWPRETSAAAAPSAAVRRTIADDRMSFLQSMKAASRCGEATTTGSGSS